MSLPKIIFLCASESQPREIKRIQSFISKGYDVEVYGFIRGYYQINKIGGITFNSLGVRKSGQNYFYQFFNAAFSLFKVFRKESSKNVIFYSFSFDLALICKLFSGRRYVYEISDIVYAYFSFEFLIKLFKNIDKWIIQNSYLSVVTSEGFTNYLFKKNTFKNIINQPNKLDIFFKKKLSPIKYINQEKIVFSYVGAFRYPDTVFRFAKVIGEVFKNHEFHFYGDSIYTEEVKKIALKYTNIIYSGAFRNPEDLESIYNHIDVVVACYDTSSLNERIAIPNKLYEAIFFNKPIIVSTNTFLAKEVQRLQCGFDIVASSDQGIINFINSLKISEVNRLINQISQIPKEFSIDDEAVKVHNILEQTFLK